MVHLNAHHPDPPITNHPHQHAFVVVGDKATFAVHMTQYHCEVHKYQLIFRFSLPAAAQKKLSELRALYPDDTFVLCNAAKDEPPGTEEMTVPDLASGATSVFLGNIFQGMRPIRPDEFAEPNFFPWSLKRSRPAIAEVEVTVDRVIMFRPFAHNETRPPHPNYLIWGAEGEAHMTNLQTAALFSGPFDPPAWGPDFDHVMSFPPGHPDWVDPSLLAAGITASVPAIDMEAPETWPIGPMFPQGATVTFLYRGTGSPHISPAGPTYLNATAVCNSPPADPHGGTSLYLTETPRIYWT
jgi:hypothetical protein